MKSIARILSLTVAMAILILISCDDLEEVPHSLLSPANFYQTSGDAEAAIMGTYASMQGGGGGAFYQQTFAIFVGGLDDSQQGQNNRWSDPARFNFDATSQDYLNVWRTLYRSVNVCNAAIDNIPDISMNVEEQNSLIGEARFMRALAYFNLVRLYGPVPLEITESIDLSEAYKSRSPVVDVYALIVEDLQFAEENIMQAHPGRATAGAAKGLLAKVYLTMAGVEGPNAGEASYYQLARDKAAEVLGMGYSLQADFDQVFDVDNEGNSEILFELEYSRGIDGQGSRGPQLRGSGLFWQSTVYHPNLGTIRHGFNTGWGIMVASHKWCNSVNILDYRRNTTVVTEIEKLDGTFWRVNDDNRGAPIIKWQDPQGAGFDAHENNIIILRYADILLTFAEAENEVNPLSAAAYDALEQVRKRARDADGVNITGVPADLTGAFGSKEEFRQAIIDERNIELAFENAERWFDLKRHGLVEQEVTEVNLQPITQFDGMEFLPIPFVDLTVNENLTQNSGW